VDLPVPVPAGDLLGELRRKRLLVPASQIDCGMDLVTSGHAGLDRVSAGGFPRGGIVEVLLPTSGGGAILYAFLAATTARQEIAALVDPADGFDVTSAQAAGVALDRLLWVRARSRKEALRAAETILEAGGFAAVVLDMRPPSPRCKKGSQIPSSAWMRLRRLASASRAVLLVLSGTPETGTFASLSVRVHRGAARFHGAGERWLGGVDLSFELRKKKYG